MTWNAVIEAVTEDVRNKSQAQHVDRVAAQYRSAIRTYAAWLECPLDSDATPYLSCALEDLLGEVDECAAAIHASLDTRYVYRARLKRAWLIIQAGRSG